MLTTYLHYAVSSQEMVLKLCESCLELAPVSATLAFLLSIFFLASDKIVYIAVKNTELWVPNFYLEHYQG